MDGSSAVIPTDLLYERQKLIMADSCQQRALKQTLPPLPSFQIEENPNPKFKDVKMRRSLVLLSAKGLNWEREQANLQSDQTPFPGNPS